MKKNILTLFAASLLCLSLAGCAASSEEKKEETVTEESSTEDKVYKVHELASLGDMEISVRDFKREDTLEGEESGQKPGENQEYVVINVELVNNDNQAVESNIQTDFMLTENGEPALLVTDLKGLNGTLNDTIGTDQKAQGDLVYIVDQDAKLTLTFKPSYGLTEKGVTFDLE